MIKEGNTMALERYRDEYSGCELDNEGEYVQYDDVMNLLSLITKQMEKAADKDTAIAILRYYMDENKENN